MEQKSDFAIPVAAAPAYLSAAVAAVSGAGALFILALVGYLMASAGRLSAEPIAMVMYIVFPLMALGLLASAAVMVVLARAEFRLLRSPPVFTAEGVRLRGFARSGYDVFLPWERISRLRVGEVGPRPFLMIGVERPEELAAGDPDRIRRMHRTMSRFEGAAFVYGLRGSLVPPEDIEDAVRRLSGGSVTPEPEPSD